jgi:CubicO group peptidase (beta-lactamase class C family)
MVNCRLALIIAILTLVGCSSPYSSDSPARLDDGIEVASPGSVGLRIEALARLNQDVIVEFFPNTTSILVLKDGKLVFERYFGEGGPEVLNDTRSAMKSITALAVGAALADGALQSVDEPAFARLADRAPFAQDGPLKQQITLADFLTMSSALDCNDWDEANPGNEENMYPLDDWSRWAVDIPLKSNYRRDASGRGPYSYCTAGVFLLGQILQHATGDPVDGYINRRLLDPLGITSREWPRSPSGEVMTGGGLRLRSRDLAKLGLLVSSAGRWGGQQLVPKDWVAEALTIRRTVDAEQGYGYLFWHREYRSACGPLAGWYMSGNGGNVVVYVPDQALVVVVTRRHYNQRGMHQQTLSLLEDHVLAALTCSTSESGTVANQSTANPAPQPPDWRSTRRQPT